MVIITEPKKMLQTQSFEKYFENFKSKFYMDFHGDRIHFINKFNKFCSTDKFNKRQFQNLRILYTVCGKK